MAEKWRLDADWPGARNGFSMLIGRGKIQPSQGGKDVSEGG